MATHSPTKLGRGDCSAGGVVGPWFISYVQEDIWLFLHLSIATCQEGSLILVEKITQISRV